ncbi:hypothetical protein M426DRAFT_262553 [Hypoxylon sp. CI-4A]|nr:hypothetical protein M426DRAFT_262553 [Hypoxylon sp. CI-4A]
MATSGFNVSGTDTPGALSTSSTQVRGRDSKSTQATSSVKDLPMDSQGNPNSQHDAYGLTGHLDANDGARQLEQHKRIKDQIQGFSSDTRRSVLENHIEEILSDHDLETAILEYLAQNRDNEAEQHANREEHRANNAEHRANLAEHRAKQAEERANEAELRTEKAEEHAKEIEERVARARDEIVFHPAMRVLCIAMFLGIVYLEWNGCKDHAKSKIIADISKFLRREP